MKLTDRVLGAVAAGYLFARAGDPLPHRTIAPDDGAPEPDMSALSEQLATYRGFDGIDGYEGTDAGRFWRAQSRFASRIWRSADREPPDWRRFYEKVKRLGDAISAMHSAIEAFKTDDPREFSALKWALTYEVAAFHPEMIFCNGSFGQNKRIRDALGFGVTNLSTAYTQFVAKDFYPLAFGLAGRLNIMLEHLPLWTHHDKSAMKYAAIWHLCYVWWNVSGKLPGFSNSFDDTYSRNMPAFQKFAFDVVGHDAHIKPMIFRDVTKTFKREVTSETKRS